MFNKKHNAASKIKISSSLKGRTLSSEVRIKMSLAAKSCHTKTNWNRKHWQAMFEERR